jgi:hypothetical protein
MIIRSEGPSKPRHLTLERERSDAKTISFRQVDEPANGVLIPRNSSDDYFDRTAEIEEATIVLPEMAP